MIDGEIYANSPAISASQPIPPQYCQSVEFLRHPSTRGLPLFCQLLIAGESSTRSVPLIGTIAVVHHALPQRRARRVDLLLLVLLAG